jgi:hypothetical protein
MKYAADGFPRLGCVYVLLIPSAPGLSTGRKLL